jgi:hypothetical protein
MGGLHDVLERQVVVPHVVGIRYELHGEFAVAEDSGDAHALDPLEAGHDEDVGEVDEVLLVGVGVRRVDVHIHQLAVRRE